MITPFRSSTRLASLCIIGTFLLVTASVYCQPLNHAKQLSQSGAYHEAETIFQKLLNEQPENGEVVLAHAYNLSWMGKHQKAVEKFKRAEQLGANWEDANLGIAYASAWSFHYDEARKIFSDILRKNPDNLSAQKGLAYTYLWQGNNETAILYFDQLIEKNGPSYDLLLAKGQSHLNNGDNNAAKSAFQMALEFSPDSDEVQQYLELARQTSRFLEVNLWSGYSVLGNDENKFGLRGVQLTAKFNNNWQAFAKYDNSLALDILNFVRQNKNIPTLSGGVVREWNKNFSSEIEYGVRFLEEDKIQHLVSGGQVYFLPWNVNIKIGGFVGFGQDLATEGMAYLSLNLPIINSLRLEPSYYYVLPPNNSSKEHRLQMRLQYLFGKGYEVNLYGLYGQSAIADESGNKQIYGWSTSALAPITPSLWGQLIVRQEIGVFNDFTSMALGVKVRFNQ